MGGNLCLQWLEEGEEGLERPVSNHLLCWVCPTTHNLEFNCYNVKTKCVGENI